jgi:NADPH:quinone reductase-like Zn-dependent oxidoreductase
MDTLTIRGEVLIRVTAAGINFADIMARLGLYPDAPKPPCVVGYEVTKLPRWGHLSAIDLATIIGAKVIGIASAAKRDFLHRRGVQLLIDSRAKDMVDRVKQLTDGRGVDLVLDARGGRSGRDSYDCLAPTGRLAVFGLATAVGTWPMARNDARSTRCTVVPLQPAQANE